MENIIFEDNHLFIVGKKSTIPVQSDISGDKCLLEHSKEYIKNKYHKKGNVFLGLVNRIDRPTSGIVIMAKTSKCLRRMNEKIRLRKIKKKYWVLVEKSNIKKKDILKNFLRKNSKKNKSFVVEEKSNNCKEAILEYKTLKKLKNYLFLEVILITGRHHQIRVQFSNIGAPVRGDVKYGAKRALNDKSICLHSREIEFEHPVNNELINLKCSPPDEFLSKL